MAASELEQYREHVKQRLSHITEILAGISADDFTSRIDFSNLPKDEFLNVFRGLDLLMDDLVEARKDLEAQGQVAGARAEIWTIAIDKALPEDQFVNGLFAIVGPLLHVSRASLFVFDSVANVARCTHQWCAPGLSNTLGLVVPLPLVRTFLGRDVLTLNLPDLSGTDQATAQTRALLEQTGVSSFIAVPFPSVDAETAQGYFSFTDQMPNRKWSSLEMDILGEVIKIFSSRLALVQAEDTLRTSNERLERRVEKQTEEIFSANRELGEEKELLDVTLRSIGDAVISTDTTGRVVLMNGAAEALTGWDQKQAVGASVDDVITLFDQKTREKCPSPLLEAHTAGGVATFPGERVLVSKDGAERIISGSAALIKDKNGSQVIGTVLVLRDITDRKRMEHELFRAAKMESLGLLAGGIAHDFNNILTGIVTNLFMSKMAIKDNDEAKQLIMEAEKAAFRASRLTKQLLTFSKGGTPVKETVSLKSIIEDAVGFSLSGSNVDYKLDVPDDLWPVEADRGQIDQVINNLVINADQAMPDGGSVTVKGENVTVGDGLSSQTSSIVPLPPGRYVKVAVVDEGIGIRAEDLERIFDPYYTTKQDGSGLGLTTAFSIVRKHGGYMTAKSVLGKGSRFIFYLPAAGWESEETPGKEERLSPGTSRVLVMDDDEIVRTVVQRLLKTNGYQVECVTHGQAAIEAYKQAFEENRRFNVVIMDLTVPGGIGGKDAVRQILAIDPDAEVIVFSGYSNDPVMANYGEYGFCGVIAKPFSIDDFSRVLNKTMRS
jgi:PAS domain S-box-containing protein